MTLTAILRRPLAGLLLALGAAPALAAIGANDNAPAATLLLPYFEVDLADPNGPQTRFTLNNVEAAPVMAHVVLWSNLGIPTYSFDLYLGGRDSVEVDLRLLFEGVVPATGPGLHAAGPLSDAQAPLCQNQAPGSFYPGFPAQRIAAASLDHLQRAHRGLSSPLTGGLCVGRGSDPDLAIGYVTVDTANSCGDHFPNDPGYFVQGGAGFASNRNALVGTYSVAERGAGVSSTSALVHLEADASDPLTSQPGAYTFWSKVVAGTAADNREGLGTVWQARVFELSYLDADTELVVWRDAPIRSPFACSNPFPPPFPLDAVEVAGFDEQEEGEAINRSNPYPNPPPPPLYPFPYAAQRVNASLLSPFPSGFVHLNLNYPTSSPPAPSTPDLMQSYVATRHRATGLYGAERPATRLLAPYEQAGGASSCSAGIVCSYRSAVIGF